jgi:hypothetical protein
MPNLMPNPNAIVSTVVRFDPPMVELEGGRRVRLDPQDPRSPGLTQIMAGISKQKLPVYLEIDPATSSITRLLIPHVTRVVAVHAREGGLDVELELSHGRHVLSGAAPDFAELEIRLRESLTKGNVIVVTEDDAHNIIDIRSYTPGPDSSLPPLPPFPRPKIPEWPWPFRWLKDVLLSIWFWCWWPWWWFRSCCVSPIRAQQIFDAMAATTCNPSTVPPPCIPFMYPDDGCWGRAHEMCRLIRAMGASPTKVWIQRVVPGYLHVNTKNNPNCFVEWGWHVAPTICVRRWWWFVTARKVIDPSMFITPVSKATWKAAQNNPGATLTDTSWTIFYLWGMITDPTFAQTNSVLATYRLQLQTRSLGPAGPPPYAYCP